MFYLATVCLGHLLGGKRCDLCPNPGSTSGESVQPNAKRCAADEREVLAGGRSLLFVVAPYLGPSHTDGMCAVLMCNLGSYYEYLAEEGRGVS